MPLGRVSFVCRANHVSRAVDPNDLTLRYPLGETCGQPSVAAAKVKNAFVASERDAGKQLFPPTLLVG